MHITTVDHSGSQSRHGLNPLLLCEAAILFACYVAAAFLAERLFEEPGFAVAFLLDHNGLLRIGFAVAAIVTSLYFSHLYESFGIISRVLLFQQICLAVGIAFLTQAFLSYLVTGWIIPRYTMFLGSAMVLMVIPVWRICVARAYKA